VRKEKLNETISNISFASVLLTARLVPVTQIKSSRALVGRLQIPRSARAVDNMTWPAKMAG